MKTPLNLKKDFIGELLISNLEDIDFNDLIKEFKTIRNDDDFNLIKIIKYSNNYRQETFSEEKLIAITFDYSLMNETDIKLKLKNLKNIDNENLKILNQIKQRNLNKYVAIRVMITHIY